MIFIQKLFRLCTDLTIYREITNQKTSQSIGYFTLFYVVFSLTVGLIIKIGFVPELISTTKSMANDVLTTIPMNAVFTVESGKLTASGSAIPLIIGSIATFEETNITINSPDEENIRIPYTDAEISGTITGTEIHQGVATGLSLLDKYSPYAAYIIAVPLFIGLWIGRFINAAIYASIFSLGNMLWNRKNTFSSFLRLTLHTITVAELVNALVFIVYGQSYSIVFSVAFFGITTLAYMKLPAKNIPPSSSSPS